MIHSNQKLSISGMTMRQAANPHVEIVRPINGLRTLKIFVAEAAPIKKAIDRTVKIFQGVTDYLEACIHNYVTQKLCFR